MKRKIKSVLCVLLLLSFCGAALAAAGQVTLRASDSVDRQAEAFFTYLNALSERDRQAWQARLEAYVSGEEAEMIQTSEAAEQVVYGTKSGKRYHKTPSCSNMKDPIEMTLSEAQSRGLTPCKRCKP